MAPCSLRALSAWLLLSLLGSSNTVASPVLPAGDPAVHACTAAEADQRRLLDERMAAPPTPTGAPAAVDTLALAGAQLFGLGTVPDLARAMALFTQAAARGDAEAMRWLGDIHAVGGPINRYGQFPSGAQCILVDLPRAAYWYRRAAERGNAFAQEQLAIATLAGLGVQADPVQAERWLEAIGKERRAHAVFYLADQYLYGGGDVVPQDLAKGAHYTLVAAELGHPLGLAQLGALHEHGTGVEQDDVKAYAYALAAHDEGLPIEDHHFAHQVATFQARMTEAQQAEALQLFRSIRQLLHSDVTYL